MSTTGTNLSVKQLQDQAVLFISYSRRDQEFTRLLERKLRDHHLEVAADWLLVPGPDYKDQLRDLVLKADAFVFIITPASVNSESCATEIRWASEENKRMLPLLLSDDYDREKLTQSVRAPQWTDFRNRADFEDSLERLVGAVNTNFDLMKRHTELIVRAEEWIGSGRNRSYLLRGSALHEAEEWLPLASADTNRLPNPTRLQTDYILTSRRARSRGLRVVMGVAFAVILALLGLSIVAVAQTFAAKDNETQAILNADTARQQQREAEHNAREAKWQQIRAEINAREADKQRDKATESAIEARRQEGIAVSERQEAERQRDEADQLLNVSVRELNKSFVDYGKAIMQEDPAVAVKLAEAATKLGNSVSFIGRKDDLTPNTRFRDMMQPTFLLQRALLQTPVWGRFGPATAPDLFSDNALLPRAPKDTDVFATDPAIQVILGRADNATANKTDPLTIVLREVPTGKILTSLQLQPGETVLAPDPSTTKLFATVRKNGKANHVNVHDLSVAGFEHSALSMDGVRSIAFTDGNWPCYVLTESGDLLAFKRSPEGTGDEGTKLGNWPDAQSVEAYPGGGALALVRSDEISWIEIASAGRPQKIVSIEWKGLTSKSPDVAHPFRLRWGPAPQYMLVSHGGNEELVIKAIDAATSKTQELYRGHYSEFSETRWLWDTDRNGSRLAITTGDVEESKIQITGLNWKAAPSDKVVKQTDYKDAGALVGKHPAQTSVFVRSMVVSPNGNFVVVANGLKGRSGFQNPTGIVESWSITPLKQATNALPEASEFKIGDELVLRFAYSADSSRLVIWDTNEISHIFQLRSQPASFNKANLRIPEQWEHRFFYPLTEQSNKVAVITQKAENQFSVNQTGAQEDLHPSVDLLGKFARFALVNYGNGDRRIYDLRTGEETKLRDLFGDSPLLTIGVDEDGTIVVVTLTEILHLRQNQIVKRIAFSEPPVSAESGTAVISVLTPKTLLFYDPKSLEMLGSIALASEDSYLLDVLKKKAAKAPTADRYEVDPWLRENNLFRTFIFEKRTGKFTSVLLERSADGKKLSIGDDLYGGPDPGNQIVTAFRAYLVNPDMLFLVVKGKSISEQTFFQLRLSDGKQVNLYKIPPPGLPPAIDGISAYAVEDKMVMIFSYEDTEKSSESLESAPRFVIGVWPRQGGECLKGWIAPAEDVARIIYVEPVGGKDIAYLMTLRTDGHRDITLGWATTKPLQWALCPSMTFLLPTSLRQRSLVKECWNSRLKPGRK